ncbi:MAG: CHAT domain-containing protein [Candidatus Brocadiaceae bacterium]|nr:CHAT domain-containing protein [Candidatus Brocadiaceae bacterium]
MKSDTKLDRTTYPNNPRHHSRQTLKIVLIFYCVVSAVMQSLDHAYADLLTISKSSSPEVVMARGLSSFQQGKFEEAISSLIDAADLYAREDNLDKQLEALTHLSRAYESIGRYQNALKHLEFALLLAKESGDLVKTSSVLGSIGSVYIATGHGDKAYRYLKESLDMAEGMNYPGLSAVMLNNIGNLYTSQKKYKEAIDSYMESMVLAQIIDNHSLISRTLINAAKASMLEGEYKQANGLLDKALEPCRGMIDSYDKAFGLINIGLIYHDLRPHLRESGDTLLLQASELFNEAATVAETIENYHATSHAWGNLGKLYEEEHRYQEALELTRRAIFAAQKVNALESVYLWQWQSGRLLNALGEIEDAISAYRRTIHNIQSIRQEMSMGYVNIRLSFRKSVRPVYFELVDLLLQRAASMQEREKYEPYLIEARNAVELLKVADLRDYFQDDCVDAARSRITKLDIVSQTAVIVYPILLPDRTELLVSLPSGLKRFSVQIGRDILTQEVRKFRRKLEKRTTREYLPHAQKLYDWLIRPLEQDLDSLTINTLVFVPDGPLRTIPMAALHDGENFLISKYALATTPGLELTDPHPIKRENSKMLAAGLTESVQGFPPLPHVAKEFETIRKLYGDNQLINKDFLVSSMEEKLSDEKLSIVHIASHGHFGNNSKDTFLLTYDDKLTMDRLSQLVGRFEFRDDPLELLILSACETAAGDDRAALGLAGVAVKAGARSAIATLWYINDQASSVLISEFYRQIQDRSISRSVALQRAKLKLIKDQRYSHPCYWSPFLLINNWL